MPWHTSRSDSCPDSKPWAVIKDDDGTVEGCHATEDAAKTQMRALYANEGKSVEIEGRGHLLLKATATVTDQGTFTAVISTESIDREKDVVAAQAMVDALAKWNRPIPLAWNHSTAPEDIIGHIDPQSVQAKGGEVVASGQVDLESNQGKEAWRSFKSRTVGFSFGYMILAATKRKGGGRHITGLDVFEVTATPTPMNNDTRVLGWKGMGGVAAYMHTVADDMAGDEPIAPGDVAVRLRELASEMDGRKGPRDEDQLRKETRRLERERVDEKVPVVERDEPAPEPDETELQKQLQEIQQRLEDLEKKAEEADRERKTRSADPLLDRSRQAMKDIHFDGVPERRPPARPDPGPEPPIEADLMARTQAEMMEILRGA